MKRSFTYRKLTRLRPRDVASMSKKTPGNKICKPLVVYTFMGNALTSITMLRTYRQHYNVSTPEMRFQSICHMINRI